MAVDRLRVYKSDNCFLGSTNIAARKTNSKVGSKKGQAGAKTISFMTRGIHKPHTPVVVELPFLMICLCVKKIGSSKPSLQGENKSVWRKCP